jgi:4-hydroxy-tetrahydrodipicolinate synthase
MKIQKKYQGVVVPMMTPFTERLSIDENAVGLLVEHLIRSKTFPFVLGTTGEAVSIPRSEKLKMVAATVKASAGRTLVYAGISSNCMQESVEEGKAYAGLGADALVATMPSYYPVGPGHMLRYFSALADELPAPLIIYNIPSTTHLSIPIDIVEKLSTHPNIAGFKDSEKGEERITAATGLWKNRTDFSYLLGWALKSSSAMEQGADGIVPSSGNLAPALYQAIYDASLAGDRERALLAQKKADHVSELYQKDRLLSDSLSAFKAMLSAYGLCGPYVLPPLYRLPETEENNLIKKVREAFGDLDQINSL